MRTPDDIQLQLLTILEIGLSNIRVFCEQERYDLCNAEANHIHNLPDLIRDFSAEKLAYYLDVEVTQYQREIGGARLGHREATWETLRTWLSDYRRASGSQ